MSLLLKVDSKYCVRLLGWEKLPQGWSLVLEHLNGMNLLELYSLIELNPSIITEIMAQVQLGLKDLHAYGLMHGDLTPQNIFITETGGVKLLDFGLSQSQHRYGQPQFVSLEFWQEKALTCHSDLYSLGLIYEDLLNTQIKTSKEKEFWKDRAYKIKNKNSLLAEQPEKRQMLEISSSDKDRKQLADKIQEAKLLQVHYSSTRQIQPSTTSRPGSSIFFKISMFLLLFFLPQNNQVVYSSSQGLITASPPKYILPANKHVIKKENLFLQVRSHQWAQASLYKCESECSQKIRRMAFTPVIWSDLAPGTYNLKWSNSEGEFQAKFNLTKNRIFKISSK